MALPPSSKQPLTSQNEVESAKRQDSIWNTLQEWWWELFTWVLGTSALLTIVILLFWLREKPAAAWKSNVQVTAIIAALSQTAQSALLVPVASCIGQLKWLWFKAKPRKTTDLETFDMASRGPEGSLKLLFQMPRLRLVSLGAIATVLMLSFQTFIQQSLRTDMRRIVHKENTAILRRAVTYSEPKSKASFNFAGQYSSAVESGWQAGPVSQEMEGLDFYIIDAINSGMFDNYRSLSNVTASCSTADCSWPRYNSLGICTAFEDIGDQLQPYPLQNKSLLGYEPFQWYPPGLGSKLDSLRNAYKRSDFFIASLSYNDRYNRSTPSATEGRLADLANIYLVYHDNCLVPNGTALNEQGPLYNKKQYWRAMKATMRFCIQNLESSFNSTMNTRIITESPDLQWHTTYQELGVEDPALNCNESWTWNYNADCVAQCTTPPDGTNDTFCIRDTHMEGIGWQIANTFNASSWLGYEGTDTYYFYGGMLPTLISDVVGPQPTTCTRGPVLGIEGFKRRVNNVAISMSNAMRTANSSTIISGAAWETVPFVRLEPYWLAMPAFIWASITLLLLCTILENRRAHVPIWKHTTLGLLSSLKGEEQGKLRNNAKEDAKHSAMYLAETSGFWKFAGVS